MFTHDTDEESWKMLNGMYYTDSTLLGCDALSLGEQFPTFESTVLKNFGNFLPSDTTPFYIGGSSPYECFYS
jgi:hypothetical protein